MNPGIYYLYEYQNKTRRRNVGFLKIARHYQSCILQIHLRGIGTGNGASLELWAFCLQDGDMVGSRIAALTCFNRTISARLPVSESTFPEERSLSEIDGFLVRLPGGNPPIFWIASGQLFDADPAELREPAPASPDAASQSPEEGDVVGDLQDLSDLQDPLDLQDPPEIAEDVPEVVPEDVPDATPPGTVADSSGMSSDTPGTAADAPAGNSPEAQCRTGSAPDHSSARKIQRSDLTRLPKKFWTLANNSFLLHGYHNYGHLLLVEEEGHVWLGVPGIYDPREARAAELFGFPQFTRSHAEELELSEEERNDSADFGHWCRYLDTAKRTGGENEMPG